MRHHLLVLLLAMAMAPVSAEACSCVGPHSFCETLDPPPPFGAQWWTPSDIVLLVKQATYSYGADMRVVQTFHGAHEPEDIIRVWGDCGLLCRHYVTGLDNGDTVLWALRPTDLSGNSLCGTSLEVEGDYQLPICGVYWLDYANGIVSGSITLDDWSESMPLSEFAGLVNGCLPTGMDEQGPATIQASFQDEQIVLSTDGDWSETKQVCVTDASGRVLVRCILRGARGTLPKPTRATGMLVIRVNDERRSFTARLLVD